MNQQFVFVLHKRGADRSGKKKSFFILVFRGVLRRQRGEGREEFEEKRWKIGRKSHNGEGRSISNLLKNRGGGGLQEES